jgi:hypothetical protein
VTVAAVVLRQAVVDGELPPDLDVGATSRALGALLDGVVLECVWTGRGPALADIEQRALLLLRPTSQPQHGDPVPGPARGA